MLGVFCGNVASLCQRLTLDRLSLKVDNYFSDSSAHEHKVTSLICDHLYFDMGVHIGMIRIEDPWQRYQPITYRE